MNTGSSSINRLVSPLKTILSSNKQGDFNIIFRDDKYTFTRYRLSAYSILVRNLPLSSTELKIENGEYIKIVHNYIENDQLINLKEDNYEMIHLLALELRIPKIIEVTAIFSLFLKYIRDAFNSLESKSSDLQKQSRNFLAYYYPLFAQTSIFRRLKAKQWILIFNSPDRQTNAINIFLTSLSCQVNWTDDDTALCLKEFKKQPPSTDAIDQTLSAYDRSSLVVKELEQMKKNLAKKSQIKYSDNFDELWDEFSSFFSPSDFTKQEEIKISYQSN